MEKLQEILNYTKERIRLDNADGFDKGYGETTIKHQNDKILRFIHQVESVGEKQPDTESKLNIADVSTALPPKYCDQCGEPINKRHKSWCSRK